jgi:GT2 family glycosyltransferase
MNFALSQSDADIVIRTDDDVIFSPKYVEGILEAFMNPSVLGVTGPTVIPPEFQANRDLMRLIFVPGLLNYFKRNIYNFLCDGKMYEIGYFSSFGVFSIGTNLPSSINKEMQEVAYLEACNFALRRKQLISVGGFSVGFGDIGEYHEPDTCFLIKRAFKTGIFVFSPQAALYHCPSMKGVFSSRFKISPRVKNYCEFIRRNRKDALRHVKIYKSVAYLVLIILFFSARVRSPLQLLDIYASFKNILALRKGD